MQIAQNKALKRYRILFHVFGPLMPVFKEWVLLLGDGVGLAFPFCPPAGRVMAFVDFPALNTSVRLGTRVVNDELSISRKSPIAVLILVRFAVASRSFFDRSRSKKSLRESIKLVIFLPV